MTLITAAVLAFTQKRPMNGAVVVIPIAAIILIIVFAAYRRDARLHPTTVDPAARSEGWRVIGLFLSIPLFLVGVVSCGAGFLAAIKLEKLGDLYFIVGGVCLLAAAILAFRARNIKQSPTSSWEDDKRKIYDADGNVTGYIDKD